LTSAGVRAADVAWASIEHYDNEPEELFTKAPAICVEVWSPSNTLEEFEQKKRLYFEAGALEVWTCSRDGQMRFFVPTAELEGSKLVAEFPSSINQHSSS
jgi:Uma2 family endonuclease